MPGVVAVQAEEHSHVYEGEENRPEVQQKEHVHRPFTSDVS